MKNLFSKKRGEGLSGVKGFTLIEMLVVVGIIGVLASLVLVGLGPSRQAGRDARRISNLNQVRNLLEVYHLRNGEYPNINNFNNTNLPGLDSLGSVGDSVGNFCYMQVDNGLSYRVAIMLERDVEGGISGNCDSNTCGSNGWYCLEAQ